MTHENTARKRNAERIAETGYDWQPDEYGDLHATQQPEFIPIPQATDEDPYPFIRILLERSTQGRWAWRGAIDGSVMLRSTLNGREILKARREVPCYVKLYTGEVALAEDACAKCRESESKGDHWEDAPLCERQYAHDTTETIWVSAKPFPEAKYTLLRPLNDFATSEVLDAGADHMYRSDVSGTIHPDASLIAHAREFLEELMWDNGQQRQDITKLRAEIDRLRSAIAGRMLTS